MINVLFIDRHWPMVAQVVREFADSLRGSDIHVLFLSEKEASQTADNFEIINIHDIAQKQTLEELQATYSFSLHKTLVPERAFYDYSSFRRSQCYSRLNQEQIAERVAPYANALDVLIRERADLVLEWCPDCFIPQLAGNIAAHYGKPFKGFMQHYWWSDGAFFLDRLDLTSSDIDEKYRYYYDNPALCDRAKLDAIFASKKTLYAFSASEMYTLSTRFRIVMNRVRSYQPPSILNWVIRRISRAWSARMIRMLASRLTTPRDESFVLYPLCTSPEASLLGSYPEMADQFGLIKNISMNLPYGVMLYIKEHPLADLGAGFDQGFYRRVGTLPNVRIMRSDASLDGLMGHPRCIAVAVLTGSVGVDAAIRRKPVFLFGRALYGAAACFLTPASFDEFYSQLTAITRGDFRFNDQALYAMLNALDSSIVRADVDFLASRTSAELLMCFPPIWRNFVQSRAWQRPMGQSVGPAA